MHNLLVMKFGGTSVGSAERMRVAARLVAEQSRKRPVVMVVSAMSKITDLLLDTMRHAEAADHAGVEKGLSTLRQRHEQACRELLPEARQAEALDRIAEVIGEFERLKEFNENIVESINVGILAIDLDDRIESWNAQMEAMYALSRAEALGQRLQDVFPVELVEAMDGFRNEQ